MQLKERKGAQHKHSDVNQEQITDIDVQKQAIKPLNQQLSHTYISFCKLLLRILNLCLSSFYFGYTIAYLGAFDYDTIIELYQVQREKETVQGLLQGVVCIGAGFGALGSSLVLKTFSRKNSVLFTNLVAFICGILILIQNLYVFFVARFIQGTCIGLYSAIIPLLIKQYSPTEICGVFGAFNQVLIAFGVFFVFLFQLILIQLSSELEHWRIVFGLTLITIVIQTILLVFKFKEQTPKYLLLNGREEECKKFIQQNYKPQFVYRILKQKKADINLLNSTESEIKKQKENQQQIVVNNVQLNTLDFKKGRKIRIIAAVHLAILQQLVGINSVVAYGVEIVAEILPSMSKIIPVILNLQSVIAGLLSSILLARVGRKTILQAGTLTSAISLTMVSIGFLIQNSSHSASNFLVILGLVIFMANFGLSLGPVTWLYIAQIVQPQIIPFTTMSNWAFASLVIIAFPILSVVFGTPVPLFFFFAAWSAGSLFVNRKIFLQTKGKTEKQIREEYCTI